MVELYTIMRYLQYDTLQKMGLSHFDDWAASFGETVTAIELSPEGTGYRAKTRFARFFNLPELISLFKESADVQTADMLNLPVPQAEYINEVLKPSETQEEMVSSFADRAEAVRNGSVNPKFDNMLKITNDGRKLALDQRLMNEMLPDEPESKVNRCVDNAFKDCASKGQQAVNLFSGIVRCGGCGQNMVRRTVSKNGKKYIYLHCVTNHNGLGCSSHLISESKLAEVVLAALQGKVQQISGLEHRLDEINEIHPVQIVLGIRNFRLNLKNVCTDSICQIFSNFCGNTAGRKIGDKSFAHDNALPLDNFV